MTARMNRRIYGMLSKRLDEAGLDLVTDERDARGKRWRLGALLRASIGAMLAGAKSLAEVEALTTRLSRPIRRLLGTPRRLPDTTLRNALCTVAPSELRKRLVTLVRQGYRRKALEPDELPFGVVSLDGKAFSIPSSDDWFAQRQTHGEEGALLGLVRSVTATLSSSSARPIIDMVPIPAPTNEMGVFETALDGLCQAYTGLGLFELVTYDAGACSAHNASVVRQHRLHYLFGLTAAQPTLFEEAKRWLGARQENQADAVTEDFERGNKLLRRLFIGEVTVELEGWEHLRSVLRVATQVFDNTGKLIRCEDRYFISSLPRFRLTAEHWLLVIRRHWAVETAHQVLDTTFAEDDHPWIEAQPRAAMVVAFLRRIAYTILTLFRSVTQRSDERRAVPWKALIADVFFALVTTSADQLADLRKHRLVALC